MIAAAMILSQPWSSCAPVFAAEEDSILSELTEEESLLTEAEEGDAASEEEQTSEENSEDGSGTESAPEEGTDTEAPAPEGTDAQNSGSEGAENAQTESPEQQPSDGQEQPAEGDPAGADSGEIPAESDPAAAENGESTAEDQQSGTEGQDGQEQTEDGAAEETAQEGALGAGAAAENVTQALNEKNELKDITEELLEYIRNDELSLVKLDDGYRILNKETGKYVDPETGEEYGEAEEIAPQDEELERDAESEAAAIEAGIRAETNEALIARQQIVIPPQIEEPDFRFYTVVRVYAFAKEDLKIFDKKSEDGTAVGILQRNGLCYILKNTGEDWYYVESGMVRGFVKTEKLVTGEEAQPYIAALKYRQNLYSKLERSDYSFDRTAPYAEALVSPAENSAFTYVRATAGKTLAAKVPALAAEQINIREAGFEEARVIGKLAQDSICYILADEDKDWIYVESGDVRGFASAQYLLRDEETLARIEEEGEKSFRKATEVIEPEENKALYYTLTSTESARPGSGVREAIVEYTSQFVGNPYVWGGEDPVNGADCSGLMQYVYREFGYDLPRVSEDQAQVGMKIPVEEAAPGDLIFYAKEGHVYHVVMYAGNGKTVEARSEEYGIIFGNVYYTDAVWATRLLDEVIEEIETIPITEKNAKDADYGESAGEFEIRYFSAEDHYGDTAAASSVCGTRLVEGDTICADPSVFREGTQLIIDGHIFTVKKLGRETAPDVIEIYVDDMASLQYLGRHREEIFKVSA